MQNPWKAFVEGEDKLGGSIMDKSSLTWGTDGHLSKTDLSQIYQHFGAILKILERAGLDRVHIIEFLHGMVNNWIIDSTIRICSTLCPFMGL